MSRPPIVGVVNSLDLGTLQLSGLELSNADSDEQFVEMILAQLRV